MAARNQLRGIKRKCQNEGCGLPFYDLNRAEIACPNCGSGYEIIVPPPPRAGSGGQRRFNRNYPVMQAPVEAAAVPAEIEEAGVEAELEETETSADAADTVADVILEDEEEGEAIDLGTVPAEGREE